VSIDSILLGKNSICCPFPDVNNIQFTNVSAAIFLHISCTNSLGVQERGRRKSSLHEVSYIHEVGLLCMPTKKRVHFTHNK
jgi:hypothetical protein